MTIGTKVYIVRIIPWLVSIILVAWPLHLVRPAIGDIAYVAVAAIILGVCYWLGFVMTKRMRKAQKALGR